MQTEFRHQTVLLSECVEAIVKDPNGIYVDCTLGGGGHSAAILEKLGPQGRLIGIDRDPAAVEAAAVRLARFASQIQLVQGNFAELDVLLTRLGVGKINGILFDLGVSSPQLDQPQRGFSYMNDGPLDMRMNPAQSLSAHRVVNEYSEDELTGVIIEYGEERWARRIAKFIVAARQERELASTAELVAVITAAIPASARRQGPHPAKRTFQAIRIEVNGELKVLAEALKTAIDRLAPEGRIGVISFHSLEDRIVKNTFAGLLVRGPVRTVPVCICRARASLRLCGKALPPSELEIENNPRARSAKLRVAEKIGQGGLNDATNS